MGLHSRRPRSTLRVRAPCVGVRTRSVLLLNILFLAWIGILADLGFPAFVTRGSPPLMGNPRGQPNNCCETCQYSPVATLARNIGTGVEVHAAHPAPGTAPRFVSGTSRKLDIVPPSHSGEKRPGALIPSKLSKEQQSQW